jgi:hypothetical protein
VTLATEGFATIKYPEKVLQDRNRLSQENGLTIAEYIISMKREVNPRPSYIKYTIQFLSELSKSAGIEKTIQGYDKGRHFIIFGWVPQIGNEDPLHKWIGSYNIKRITLIRFFKWLYYTNIDSPAKRNELSAAERKPDCIMGIPQLKIKETSCYKPSDLWTQEDKLHMCHQSKSKKNTHR